MTVDKVTKAFFEKFIPKDKKTFLREEVVGLMSAQMQGMSRGFMEGSTKLREYKVFYDHVASHKEVQEAPNNPGQVMCKICNKTFKEIIKDWNDENKEDTN